MTDANIDKVSVENIKPPPVSKGESPPEKKKKANFWEQLVGVLGFGEILKAWKSPTQKKKRVLTSIFNKFADSAGNKLVVGSFKFFTITTLAGMVGGSIYMTMGVTALATGVGAAIYTYGREFFKDFVKSKKTAKVFSAPRLKKSILAFAGSAAGGAFGAWFVKTDLVQGVFNAVGKAILPHVGRLAEMFNIHAAPEPLQRALPALGIPADTVGVYWAPKPQVESVRQ